MENKTALKWECSEEGGWVSRERAVSGGSDDNGDTVYVGRAFREGDVIPGKIVPAHGVCYISWSGKEHGHKEYQILTTVDDAEVVWVAASGGKVPTGAVQGGATVDGEVLFVGRALHEGSHVLGKVHPSHSVLYSPFGGDEISHPDYEVLCLKVVSF